MDSIDWINFLKYILYKNSFFVNLMDQGKKYPYEEYRS